MNNFETLLKRYLEGTASEKDRVELEYLINTGYEQEAGTSISEDLKEFIRRPYSADVEAYEDEMFGRLEREAHFESDQVEAGVIDIERGSSNRTWTMAAAVTGIIVLLGSMYWVASDRSTNPAEIAKDIPVLSTFKGPDNISLPDGSIVMLNAGSELSYKENFGEDSREVSLKGEGFFEVVHSPTLPFIVNTGKVKTKVLGTSFNVRAFPGENVKVTVARGLVEVASDNRIYGQVKPDHQITIDSQTDEFVSGGINSKNETAWKDRMLILKDVTMQEAARLISERFSVDVIVTNKELQQCEVNTFFMKGEELEQVLDVLTKMTKAKYRVKGRTAIIEGGRCD